MNEHEPDFPDSQEPRANAAPDQAPGSSSSEVQADAFRTISLDDAPRAASAEAAATNISIVRDGIRRYGESFLAYLILDGVEQRADDLMEQYEARYLGTFPDRRSFARWAINDLGWNAELVELRHLQGMWPDDVKWDLDALWPELATRYALTERLGGVYAFRR